jgi:hypothetical protein
LGSEYIRIILDSIFLKYILYNKIDNLKIK